MKKMQDRCKTIINKIVEREIGGWPPPCWGMYYQPERPQGQADKNNIPDLEKQDIK